MSYLTPVYEGDTQETIGGFDGGGQAGIRIEGFRGASKIQAFRFNATAVPALAIPSNANRRTLTIKNEGANDVFIGGEEVTATTGYRLAALDAITLELAGELWAVTAATTEAVYVLTEVDA